MTDGDDGPRQVGATPAAGDEPTTPPRPAPEFPRPGGMVREPTSPGSAGPPRSGPWDPHHHQGWAPPPRPAPPRGATPYPARPPAGTPWTGQQYLPENPQQPTTYTERIRADALMPPPKVRPGRGWRLTLYKVTFGLVNVGPSSDERRLADLEAQIRVPLRGHFKVGVMGKGGVGKTTVSASIGSVFAELRQNDRVVAVDADTAFGKLGSRVDPKAQGSFWELASDQHLETFADIRNRVGNNAAGLFVLAGEATPARRRVLDPAIYREATARLDRHFTISVIDCSSTMDSPVTHEALRDLDALVVVSSPWVDGAAAAGQTLDWLAAQGLDRLVKRTVVVLNDSDGHADKRTRSTLAQQFSGHGQLVIEVPFDGHLRPGGVIDGTAQMSPRARRKFVEVCAALAKFFPPHDDRPRERR